MLDQDLEERAVLYATGAMTATEREGFELILEFHDEVKALVRQLQEVAASVALAMMPADAPRPSAAVKDRLMQRLEAGIPQQHREGFVVAGADGLVKWVNPEFTEMCGYSVEEVCGRKLGPILQGELTNRQEADKMRDAVLARRPCEAELINYHKNGTPYWVAIEITPIKDDDGNTRWLVARERELQDREIPAAA